MDSLRQSILIDTNMMATKQRFGLFSQPPSLAIGDDSMYKNKKAQRGEDGKPITLPRNLLAGPNRSGVDRKSYITPCSSIHSGDKFLDPQKSNLIYQKSIHGKASFHQNDFKPASGPKTLSQSAYKYIQENPKQKAKPKKDETGRIIVKPKNITSNSTSKIQRQLFKPYKYVSDPQQRKLNIQKQKKKKQKQKQSLQSFRTMSHGDLLFNKDKNVYGLDQTSQELLKRKKSFTLSQSKIFNHQTKFKLSVRGHGDPLGKYPQFIAPPASKQEVKKIKKQKDQKQDWKPSCRNYLSKPCPSICYSLTNIRKGL